MSKIDEVKKILSLYLCEAADLDFRGMTEVTCKYAEQICQLFEPDEGLLLSDKEIREIAGHYHFFSNTMSLKKDYGEMIAKAQLAKDEARHEADKVKVREQTLKEVGEWLYQMPTVITSIDGRGRGVLVYQSEIESLKAGRMP
jgi:hypothetical protein